MAQKNENITTLSVKLMRKIQPPMVMTKPPVANDAGGKCHAPQGHKIAVQIMCQLVCCILSQLLFNVHSTAKGACFSRAVVRSVGPETLTLLGLLLASFQEKENVNFLLKDFTLRNLGSRA